MGAELPRGTLTFLLTDVVDSTAWWEREPAAMARWVASHEATVEALVVEAGGMVVRAHGEGDSTLSVFGSPRDAVVASAALHDALAAIPAPGARPLRVRAGVHTGLTELRDGHYYGTTVNLAARLRGTAEPGTTVVSATTAALAVDELPPDLVLRPLGGRQLRGRARRDTPFVLAPSHASSGATTAAVASPSTGALGRAALVGRIDELARLERAVEASSLGEGRVVLVRGEAGIGKTTLCEALGERARAAGAAVFWGRAVPDEAAPPFWPWRQAFSSWHAQADPSVARRALATAGSEGEGFVGLGLAPGPSLDGDDRHRVARAMARLLTAAGPGCVFVLDDLHWADVASLHVLTDVLDELAATGVAIVGALRPDDGRDATRAELLGAAAAHPSTEVLELAGLDGGPLRTWIADELGGESTHDRVDDVARRSGGNPFVALELARWARLGEDDLPDSIREVLHLRLGRLSPSARRALEGAAVLGVAAERATLAEVLDLAPTDVASAVADLQEAGLAREDGTGVLVPEHDLVREVVYAELPAPAKARLHRAAYESLQRRGLLDDHLDEAARHASQAALADAAVATVAVELHRRAADRAAAALAPDAAITHRRAALALTGDDEVGRITVLLELAADHDRADRPQSAVQVLDEAGTCARRLGRPDLLARAAVARARVHRFDRDLYDDPDVERLLQEAWRTLPTHELALRAGVAASMRSWRPRRADEVAAKVEWAERALELAERSGDPMALSSATQALLAHSCRPGADLEELSREAVTAAHRTGDRVEVVQAHWHRALVRWSRGELAAADAELRALGGWEGSAFEVRHQLWRGQLAAAEENIAELSRLELRRREATLLDQASVLLFWLLRLADRLDELLDVVGDLAEAAPEVGTVQLAWGLTLLDTGHRREAAEVHTGLARADYRWLNPPGLFSRMAELAWAAELAHAAGDQDAARLLHAELAPFEGWHVNAALFYVGPVSHHLGLLAITLGERDEAVRRLQDAIAEADRVGAVPAGRAARRALIEAAERHELLAPPVVAELRREASALAASMGAARGPGAAG